MNVIVATALIVTIGILLIALLTRREGAPARRHVSTSRERELRIARDRLTAGLIDADQYERIVDALER